MNGGYSQNLYGHDSFGHDLDVLHWHMGSKGFIKPTILWNSLHQMPNGKWMLAEEYMSFTQSAQKYCVKVWYSASPGQDYRFDQIGSTYWNCLAH